MHTQKKGMEIEVPRKETCHLCKPPNTPPAPSIEYLHKRKAELRMGSHYLSETLEVYYSSIS